MFNKTSNALFDATIQDILTEIRKHPEDAERCCELTSAVSALSDARDKLNKSHRPSSDAVLAAAVNVAGILAILNYERLHILTTKALPFVMKLR